MNLKDVKAIFFDFGHWYNWDQWAIGNGTTERVELLDLADDIKKYYVQIEEFKNIPVYYMWLGDTPDSLTDRCGKINKICRTNWYNRTNSILVSCHLNAGGWRGVESWYETGKIDSFDLGSHISNAVSNTANIPKRTTKPDSSNRLERLWILRDTIPVATLTELCFIDNKDEAEMIKDKTKDDLFARGVLRGIKKYLWIVLK